MEKENKIYFRHIVFHCYKKGEKSNKIFQKLNRVYNDKAHSYTFVKKWLTRFKTGQTEFQDEPRSGRPKQEMTKKNKQLISKTIEDNPRVGKSYLEKLTGIPATTLKNFINNDLV